MDYKTLLVHVDQSHHAPARIRLAAALARAHGAHLVGAAMTGVPRMLFPDGAWHIPRALAANYIDPLRDAALHALDQFDAIVAPLGISHERQLVPDQDGDALVAMARYCDLLVIGQYDRAEALPGRDRKLPEHVALSATAPVLIVPGSWATQAIGHAVLVAWNGSVAATQAVHAAVPLLQRAARVCVASFRAPLEDQGATPEDQDAMLAYLRRHGIEGTPVVREHGVDAGHAILELAAESQCDLIVMGCYGHSRFRELLLGGASRTILRAATMPVLMAR